MIKIIAIVAIGFIVVSCASTPYNKNAYYWENYNDAAYAYMKLSDTISTNSLSGVYVKLSSLQRVPPTVCADYGYLLIKKGEIEQGKTLLLKEEELYPESKMFIDKFLKTLKK